MLLSLIIVLLSGLSFKAISQQIKPQASINTSHNFFIENKGQWDKKVKFLASINGLNAWITNDGIWFDFFKIERKDTLKQDNLPFHHPFQSDTNIKIFGHVIKMDFNENNTELFERDYVGKYRQDAYYNYFIGKDSTKWTSYVKLYSEILINNICQGIDMRLYFDNGMLRYDFVLNAGVNPENLKFRITGSDGLSVSEDGKLIIKTFIGNVNNNELIAFQKGDNKNENIKCGFYKIDDETIGFNIERYDHSKKLIIDPIIYSTYLGGNSNDRGGGVTADDNGYSYVTGYTWSADFPTSTGAYMKNFPSGSPVITYITKLNQDLSSIIFSTYFGGGQSVRGHSITIDKFKNIIISGDVLSNLLPVTPGAFQSSFNGNQRLFISKFNNTGTSLLASTYFGILGEDMFTVKTDTDGNIWVAGFYVGGSFPVTPDAFQKINYGSDAFISKLSPDCTKLLYSTFLGGNGSEELWGLDISKNNNVYVCGITSSNNFPLTPGCYQSTFYHSTGFVSRFNSKGKLIYSTFIDYSSSCAYGVCVDKSGCVYVSGTAMYYFKTTTNAFQTNYKGNIDLFVMKFDSSMKSVIFSTFMGGTGTEDMRGFSIDSCGNSFIAGSSQSTDFPVTPNSYKNNNPSGDRCLIMTVLNYNGSALLYSTYWGGNLVWPANNYIDNKYTIYQSGVTTCTFYTSSNAYQKIKKNGDDAFVIKINIFGNLFLLGKTKYKSFCPGDTFTVPYYTYFPTTLNNVFYLQLSDSDGNFFKPIDIGFRADTGSGTIIGTIPKNIEPGTHYKIRIRSTAPYLTSDSSGYFLIHASPKANFNDSSLIKCSGDTKFIFNNSSKILSGKINRLIWDFGDSTTSISFHDTSHLYTGFGKYKVKLTAVSDSGCTDTVTKIITLFHNPEALFNVNDSIQCFKYQLFKFIDSSKVFNGTFHFNWNFGDGNKSSIQNPSHSYNIFGDYSAKLLITDSAGCSDSTSLPLKVLASPKVIYDLQDSIHCVDNYLFSMKDKSLYFGSKLVSRLWNFGDGTFDTNAGVLHKYMKFDTFWISLSILLDNGCTDSATGKLYAIPSPKAEFTVNDSIQCLEGNKFIFNSKNQIPVNHLNWELGDGKTDTGYNISHIYLSQGKYYIKLKEINIYSCQDSSIKQIIVLPSPNASFDINDSVQCQKGNLFKFNNTSDKSSVLFKWFFGDGTTDSTVDPSHSFISTGKYNVLLVSKNVFNCPDSMIKPIVVKTTPLPPSDSSNSPVCAGNSLKLYSSLAGVSLFRWWNSKGVNVHVQNPVIIRSTLNDSGNYYVKGILDGCEGDSSVIHIIINPAPVFSLKKDITICNDPVILDPGKFTSYQWQDSSVSRVYNVFKAGIYSVKVTNEFGCYASDTTNILYKCHTRIFIPNAFSPNGDGFNDKFFILTENIDQYELKIFNRWGEMVFSNSNAIDFWDGTYKGKTCEQGVYFYQFNSSDLDYKIHNLSGTVLLVR